MKPDCFNGIVRLQHVRTLSGRSKEANHHKASDATQKGLIWLFFRSSYCNVNDEAYLQVQKFFLFCTVCRAPAATP